MASKIISALMVAGALAVPMMTYSQEASKSGKTESVGQVVDDSVITTKIKAEMAKDKAVSASSIKVDTDKGVVQLSGTAKSKAEAEEAVTIARNVKGVSNIKNDIVVQMN